MFKCELCDKEFSGLEYLQNHLRISHKFSKKDVEEYYIKYYKKDETEGIDPFTGGKTEFFSLKKGYKKFDNSEESKKKRISSMSVEYLTKVKGYTEEEANKILNDRKKQISKSVKNTNEYDKIHNPNHHLKFSYSKEALMYRGYSEEEAEKISKEAGRKVGEANKKHWKENPEKYYDTRTTRKEYWIKKGYSEEEAIQKVKERQRTFTLEKCIAKYGVELGKQKWNERQRKWSEKVEEKYKNGEFSKLPKSITTTVFSNFEINCINDIYNLLPNIKNDSYSAIVNNQLDLFERKLSKHYYYDFCYNDKIIEFNGDYWHCNPAKYKADYFHKLKNMTAREIWAYDEYKRKIAEKINFKVLTIWESEYNENPEETINKCIEFIKS